MMILLHQRLVIIRTVLDPMKNLLTGKKPFGGTESQAHLLDIGLYINKEIEPGGKAEMNGGLKVGDHVIKINDVLCLSLADAIQLIDSAFRTLTVLVWRPSCCVQNNSSSTIPDTEWPTKSCKTAPISLTFNKFKVSSSEKFFSAKCSSTATKRNEKSIPNSRTYENSNIVSYQQFQFPNFLREASQPVTTQTKPSLYKHYPKNSINENKIDFNIKSNSAQECFNPQLSQSHQRVNLEYICEQYPLSELFLNHKSDLKIESLASHSKKLLKTYQSQETNIKQLSNTKDCRSTFTPKKTDLFNVSNNVCCMYPKCRSTYKSCKMHSPPERDSALPQTDANNDLVYSQLSNYEHISEGKSNQDSRSKLESDNHSAKKLSTSAYGNTLKIKEDGFKNSDLKVFKPVELSFDSKPSSPKHYLWQQKNDKAYQERAFHLENDKCNINSKFYRHCNKEQKGSCSTVSLQKLPNEMIPDVSVEHALLINHSQEKKITFYEQSVQKKLLELCNQHSSSETSNNSYKKSFLEEKEHTMCVGVNNDCAEISNKTKRLSIKPEEISKSDGEEDEELCFIEENARNKYSFSVPNYSGMPDFALPPPPLNDAVEIIPTNEPLPAPPSFSPVEEAIYENIEVSKNPEEAIYANLEMLKIKCSVVNSSTQTSSLQKLSDASDIKSKQLSKQSFSFVETEIFSDIIGPAFTSNFRSDYLRSFLQSLLEKHSSLLNESSEKSDEKQTERHTVSLPFISAYFTTSEPKAKLLTRYINNLKDGDGIGCELTNKKEELMTSINKKLGILRLEQIALKEEMKQNEELGHSLTRKLEKTAQHNEVEKFRMHIEELEKITNLMISLSGRLARAENALLILPSDASPEEKNILEEKYLRLNRQFEEAKNLKKNIDRRSYQVCIFLRKYFTEEEFTDYDHFITMKTKLLMDYRELDEKIKLGEEQLDALKSSVSNHSLNKFTDLSQN